MVWHGKDNLHLETSDKVQSVRDSMSSRRLPIKEVSRDGNSKSY